MSASAELWQRRITHEEWKRVGEGHCATCGREGNLFLRPIDPGMLSCANCRDSIRRAYKRLTNADDPPRSQDEIEEKKFEQLLNEPPHFLARPDPGNVCMCGDRRIEHGEPPYDGPCRLNGLGHSGAPPCSGFRLNDFHDTEGRPMSFAVETEDEAKLSAFIEGARSEPRCSFCGQPEWHRDHHGQIHNADVRNHLFLAADSQ